MKSHFLRYLSTLTLLLFALSLFGQVKTAETIVSAKSHPIHTCGSEEANERLGRINPQYARELEHFKRELIPLIVEQNQGRSSSNIIYVPVVVHVIHNGESVGNGANLSDGQIEAQIEALNLDFSAQNPNYGNTPSQWQSAIGDAQIQFCLAVVDPDGNATNGITRHNIAVTGTNSNNSNIEDEIKPATYWDSNLYYNVWTVGIPGTTSGGGVTGYAYYPTNGAIGSSFDGSVVDYRWFGGPGYSQSGYSTLTHESGHYLGLPHTFDGNSCSVDDGFADTPEIQNSTSSYVPGLNCGSSFPTGPVSCGNEAMYVNFMDYVNDDDCSTSFTNDQITVMRSVLEGTMPTGGFNYGSRLPLANHAATSCSFFNNDAGVVEIIQPGANACSQDPVSPVVVIQNYGSSTLNSVTTSYQVNGGAPVQESWTLSLATGEQTTLTLLPFVPPAGDYFFSVTTTLPNGVADENTVNDAQDINVEVVIPTNLPLFEDFENSAWNPTANGVFPYDISGDGFMWEREVGVSAYSVGNACTVFDNFDGSSGNNPGGTADALLSSVYDFSDVVGASLTFDLAYAPYSTNFFDSLKIYVSTDCGATYDNLIFSDGNIGLSTTGGTVSGNFTPSSSQWESYTLDLSAFDNTENLAVAFINISGWGNRLFLDNINISVPPEVDCSLLSVDAVSANATCFDADDGIAQAEGLGGLAPYTYLWSNNATSALISGLAPGTYDVTVTDANDCTSEASVTITEPDPLILLVTGTDPTVPNGNDGTATATPVGGNSPYTYLWSNDATTAEIQNLPDGTYTVTLTDANQCTQVESITLMGPVINCDDFTVSVDPTEIVCNGGTGTLIASTTGGVEPISFAWSNGPNAAENENLSAGTYMVTATDDQGCMLEASFELVDPPVLNVALNMAPESSAGQNDGSATATVTGGQSPYTYLWSNGGDTPTIENLAGGTYAVTITDDLGCTATGEIIVETSFDCNLFVISGFDVEPVNCFGGFDGSATVNVTGGLEPYFYEWSNGVNDESYDAFQTGTYTVTITDQNDCTVSGEVTIGQPTAPLSAEYTATPSSGPGIADGSADVTVSGGTPPYTYLWGTNGTTEDLIDVEGGTYEYTVTDANGCMHTIFVVIPVTVDPCANFESSVTSTDISCFGAMDGTATVQASGGQSPYTYLWSTDATSEVIENLGPGTYTVTITDDNDCQEEHTVTISQPDELVLSLSGTDPTAPGATDGAATADVNGGVSPYEYLWSNGGNAATINDLAGGTYTVTITDADQCSQVASITLTAPVDNCADFAINDFNTFDVSCFGGSDGSATVNVTGGLAPYAYEWSNGAIDATYDSFQAGTYTVTITDENDCTISGSVTIQEPASALDADYITTAASAPGVADGSADVTVSGGTPPYTYQWGTSGNSEDLVDVEAGTYDYLVTDANGCTYTISIVIPLADNPCDDFESTVAATDVSCFGAMDGSAEVQVTGGQTPYLYAWSTGANSAGIDNLSPGTYTVTVTDVNDCQEVHSVTITQADEIVLFISGVDPSAPGGTDGSATVTASGGLSPYEYSWSNGENTATISNLSAGTYTVTVNDATQCVQQASVTINAPIYNCADFDIANYVIQDVSCFGGNDGSATVNITGGAPPFTYTWSNGGNTSTIDNLVNGSYTVTITDSENCSIIGGVDITQPEAPIEMVYTATAASGPGIEDGSADVTVSGGTPPYSYAWNMGNNNSEDLVDVSAGTYDYNVTDANGCTYQTTVEIPLATDLCAEFTAILEGIDVTCFGMNNGFLEVIVQGGASPYTYSWSHGGAESNAGDLAPGEYSVTVVDANDCIVDMSMSIAQPDEFLLTLSGNDPSDTGSEDGSAAVSTQGGIGPYTYLWSNGSVNAEISDLSEGSYGVTVTDANQCVQTSSITLSASEVDCDDFEIIITAIEVICNGGEGGLSASTVGGTSPISFVWSNGPTTNVNFEIEAGTYTVTATDADGCIAEATYTLVDPPITNLVVESTSESSPGAMDGTATANFTGGVPPYTYDWSTGATTSMISNLAGGTYSVLVTDGIGCSRFTFFTIETIIDCEALMIDEFVVQNVNCFGGFDGSATVGVSGGLEPYTYIWSNNAVGPSYDNFQAGTYTVTITDDNDCELIGEVVIEEPLEPLMATYIAGPESSPGANDGAADVTVTGGTPPYIYDWGDSQTTEDLGNVAAGTYEYTIIDANGCMHTIFIVIPGGNDDCEDLDIVLASTNVSCNGGDDGSITMTAFGGTPDYQYLWNNGSMASTLFDLTSGEYTVTVTDANNCTLTETVFISEPDPIVLSVIATDESAENAADGSAEAVAFGGVGTLTFEWSNGETTATINNLSPGTYAVTVTDEQDCIMVSEVTVAAFSADCSSLTAGFDMEQPSCPNEQDGMIEIIVTGGFSPYNVAWGDGATDFVRTNLSAGNYLVTVTDTENCTEIIQINLDDPTALSLDVQNYDGACGDEGSAFVQISGGTPGYSILWSTGATENLIEDLDNGIYTVTVTDINGCTIDGETEINNTNLPLVLDTEYEAPSCSDMEDGEIDIEVTGGTPPYTFLWSNGATTEDLEDLASGDYTVLVTDALGCSYLTTYDLTAPMEMMVDITWTPSGAGNNGSATANVFGGTTPYTYAWSNGASSAQIDDLVSGNYSVVVTDANGCQSESSVFIGITSTDDLENLTDWNVLPNPSSGQFTITASLATQDEVSLEIYNVLGQLIWNRQFDAQEINTEANLTQEAAGAYILVLRTREGIASRKLVLKK